MMPCCWSEDPSLSSKRLAVATGASGKTPSSRDEDKGKFSRAGNMLRLGGEIRVRQTSGCVWVGGVGVWVAEVTEQKPEGMTRGERASAGICK